jgi:hypothetical protein
MNGRRIDRKGGKKQRPSEIVKNEEQRGWDEEDCRAGGRAVGLPGRLKENFQRLPLDPYLKRRRLGGRAGQGKSTDRHPA